MEAESKIRSADGVVSDSESRRAILDAPETVCLVSTMKSGTHWLRYLFANYMKLHLEGYPDRADEVAPASYESLQSSFSPIDRRLWLQDPKIAIPATRSVFPFHHIKDIYWQHVDQNLETYQGKMVYIFRNPLDYAVSRYFYDKKLWENEGRDVSSVGRTMQWSVAWYCEGFATMRRIARETGRVVSVSYEELKLSPFVALGPVFRWVGFPYNTATLKRAIEMSDSRVVSEEEKRKGRAIVGPTETGYFVRDGSIGQWKKHLTAADLELARSILKGYNMRLANFITEV